MLGNRGILVIQIDVSGPDNDLHSGHYGGAAPNPAWELNKLLGTMKDESGQITIKGFYDDIRSMTGQERELLDQIEPDSDALIDNLDINGFQDEPGDSFLEKTLYYPTLIRL
ncbi:hypothetical protein BBD46_13695 [Natrialba sp. SSL1]|nr:hypothetical protein BBD46_13695 [Natrialba sp. SSL1]